MVTIVHLLNHMLSKMLNFKTLLQVLSIHISLVPFVLLIPPWVFGWVAFVHIHKNQCAKFDSCVVYFIRLGYGTQKKGYWCYNPTTRRTYVTMGITFVESESFFSSLVSNSFIQEEIQNEQHNWWDCVTFE